MNPTLPVAGKLRRLLRSRPQCNGKEQAEWLDAVATLAIDARSLAASVAVGGVKRTKRSKPEDVRAFGNSQQVVDFCHQHKLTLKHNEHWWFLSSIEDQNRTGYIHGLANSRGYPRITNGIDVWIERADGSLFKGHRDWLRWDRRPAKLGVANGEASARPPGEPAVAKRWQDVARKIWANGTVDAFAAKYATALGKPPMGLLLDTEEEAVKTISIAVNEYMERVVAL